MDCADFIRARLAEDEAAARDKRYVWPTDFEVTLNPARVLREVAATRRIMGRHLNLRPGSHCDWCLDTGWGEWPCPDVRDIAAAWSAHPDYDPAWEPFTAEGARP